MRSLPGFLTLALASLPGLAAAHTSPVWGSPGSMVGVTVEVEGQTVPLYPAPDGSGRYYLEARKDARYALRLDNRTHQRLGVLLRVDGLNVISGQQEDRGRMYVLSPWDAMVVHGWRTSLEDVRRFTFVDEQRSYATRSGKANARMGWIEVLVFREREHWTHRHRWLPEEMTEGGTPGSRDEAAPPAGSPPPSAGSTEERAAPRKPSADAHDAYRKRGDGEAARSYPGTGWGQRAYDPAVVVEFQPEREPAERVTLRYEYRRGLRALGILPQPWWGRDRLRERDRGDGFAEPPAWD